MATQTQSDEALVAKWLESDMDSPSDYRALVLRDFDVILIKEIAGYYDLSAEAILAALAYSREHPDIIAARLLLAHSADAG